MTLKSSTRESLKEGDQIRSCVAKKKGTMMTLKECSHRGELNENASHEHGGDSPADFLSVDLF